MKKWGLAATIFFLVGMAIVTCGGTNDKSCVAGQSIACVGQGACNGYQVCNQAGTGYGSCNCDMPDSAVVDAMPNEDVTSSDSSNDQASTDAGADINVVPEAGLVTLASQSHGPIAIDTSYVYFNKNGNIVKCSKLGCNDNPTVLVSNAFSNGLTIDSNNVYYATNNGVYKCGLGGCNNMPTTLATPTSNQSNPWGVAVDSNNVYFAEPNFGVRKVSINGGSPSNIYVDSMSKPYWVATDGTSVFFTTDQGKQLIKCATSGCANGMLVLASNLLAPAGMKVVGNDIYFTTFGSLLKCSINGCNGSPTVVGTRYFPWGLDFIGNEIYWTDFGTPDGGTALLKCPSNSCGSPTVLTTESGYSHMDFVAVDSFSVFWTNNAKATLSRLTPR